MRKAIVAAALLLTAAGCGDSGPTGSSGGSSFVTTGPMAVPRINHAAALLPDGRVLIVGGTGTLTSATDGALASAELYDPTTDTFSLTDSMPQARVGHVAVPLPDGRVLVAGGGVQAALVYSPVDERFSATGSTVSLDGQLQAAVLDDGRVYLTSSFSRRPEIYDPATGAFSQTSPAGVQRIGHTVTTMDDGSVVLIGGGIRLAEVFDPAADQYVTVAGMLVTRFGHAATRLLDGRVLVTGGSTQVVNGPYGPVTSAEVYDPDTRSFVSAGNMSVRRFGHTSTLLPGGDVLLMGGAEGAPERYRAAAGTFQVLGGEAGRARTGATATLLADGRVLIAGGLTEDYHMAEDGVVFRP